MANQYLPSRKNTPISSPSASYRQCVESFAQYRNHLREADFGNTASPNKSETLDNVNDNYLLEFSNQFDRLRLWGDHANLEEVDQCIYKIPPIATVELISEILDELKDSATATNFTEFVSMIDTIDEKISQLSRITPLLSELSELKGDWGLLKPKAIEVSESPTSELNDKSISSSKDSALPVATSIPQSISNKPVFPTEGVLKKFSLQGGKKPTKTERSQFFLDIVSTIPGEKCHSCAVSTDLRRGAKKKNSEPHDWRDVNLLFSSSIIQKILTPDKVRIILACPCTLCRSVKDRDLLTDNILMDAILARDGDEQRRLFALLVFIGAGFAVRHICTFYTRGWDIMTQKSFIQTQLFEPIQLSAKGIFPSLADITQTFTDIFKETWPLFATPVIQIGNYMTNLTGESLPFLNERRLNADKTSFGSMFSFEIDSEFRGENIPSRAVRKEIPFDNTTLEERQILEFFARCGKPNFVRLLFWYQYDHAINYVFPHYPGSLHQLLEGKLDTQISPLMPSKYRSILQHFLWQGMVDVTAAMKFFHFPEQTIILGKIAVTHLDLKPTNILVDESGILVLTDFGQAQIRQLNPTTEKIMISRAGDPNYRPPPSNSMGLQDPPQDIELALNQAHDVWSLACIMVEVIEYIQRGPVGLRLFRERRFREDQLTRAFWKEGPGGRHELKASVRETLEKFRTAGDQYLNTVTELLETMLFIDPLYRPPITDCLATISEDIPTEEWPLLDEDEVSICGLGTNLQLRNMHTQFQHNSEHDRRRCNIYLLAGINGSRIRVALEYERNLVEGSKASKASCILSDSAQREEEEFKPLSLFGSEYRAVPGKPCFCAFRVVHPRIQFIFADTQRCLDEYYHFMTAVTRQRSLRLKPHIYMPISNCTIKEGKFIGKETVFQQGHVEIWQELTDEEYMQEFTYALPVRKRSDISQFKPERERRNSLDSIRSNNSVWSGTTLDSSLDPPVEITTSRGMRTEVKTRRLVIFLTGKFSRLITINLANKKCKPRLGRTSDGRISPTHVTFAADSGLGSYEIGNFVSANDCPGIPLKPAVLASKETFRVNWVELEFMDPTAMSGFKTLWDLVYPSSKRNI